MLKKLIKTLGLAGVFIGLTTPAYAGVFIPILVGAATGVAVAAAGVAVAGLTVAATAIIAGVAAAAVTHVVMDAMTPSFDVPDYSSNTATGATQVNSGILVNKTGTNQPIPVVYGERKIGGSRVYVSTDGTDNRDLYIAMVFAEGEINAFKELYFDDRLVASANSLTTQITNSQFSKDSRLQYELQRGTDTQSPPSFFVGRGWTSSHRLRGLAVGYFRCRWIRPDVNDSAETQQETADANPYSGIPKIQVVVEGKKVPNANSFTDSSTTTYANMTKSYSTNPADHLLDYLMNPRFGRGLDYTRIGFTSFSTAKTKFATTVTYAGGGSGAMLPCNSVIVTDRTMLENVQTFLQNTRSGMPYVQGRFRLKPLDTGHPSDPQNTTPTITFAVTENELIGGIQIEGKGHRDQYNQIKATHPDPGNNWEVNTVIYPEEGSTTDATLLSEDSNKRLIKEISLEHITDKRVAVDVASIVLKNSRKKKLVTFTATAELHEAQVGDIITITYDSLGLSAAKFRIISHQLTADYTVNITAIEHEPTDYSFQNTDVFVGKPVAISSNDPYVSVSSDENGNRLFYFPPTIGPPIVPFFPAPTLNTTGIVSSATHQSTNTRTGNAIWKTVVSHPSDTTQYVRFSIDVVGSSSTSTPTEDYFNNNGFTDIRRNGGAPAGGYATDNYLSFNLNEKANNATYLYFRVRYRKSTGGDITSGWKRVNNVQLGSGGSYP